MANTSALLKIVPSPATTTTLTLYLTHVSASRPVIWEDVRIDETVFLIKRLLKRLTLMMYWRTPLLSRFVRLPQRTQKPSADLFTTLTFQPVRSNTRKYVNTNQLLWRHYLHSATQVFGTLWDKCRIFHIFWAFAKHLLGYSVTINSPFPSSNQCC